MGSDTAEIPMQPLHRTALAALACCLAGAFHMQPARAQSDLSQVSAISIEPSEASAYAVLEIVPAGSQLVVTGLRAVGDVVAVTLTVAGSTASVVIDVSAETVRASGIAVGTAITVSATSAGRLVCAGSEAIAFIPDQLSRSMIHHREL